MRKLVLASTSPYRSQLLAQLGLVFETVAPVCNEYPNSRESAPDLVRRLSYAKAASLAAASPNSLIIGSDQVAERDGLILGKPGCHKAAVDQLTQASGRSVMFYTGICALDTATSEKIIDVVATQVRFRSLSQAQIERYLSTEKPYDCAGSFKSEGLGISLLKNIGGDDPSALIGLPLMRLSAMLNQLGVDVP